MSKVYYLLILQFINKKVINTNIYRSFSGLDVFYPKKSHKNTHFCKKFKRLCMFNSFISVVTVIQSPAEYNTLSTFLQNIYPILKQHFTDFEVILVNNNVLADFDAVMQPLEADLKHNTFLLNLSIETERNHAIVAGLDRANGDYTVIFELAFYQQPHLLLELFQQTQKGYDIVYLKAKNRQLSWRYRWFYQVFYYILKHYSTLQVDYNAYDTRIISRRALNSLLRLRENLRYMKAIYSIVGYKTSQIEVAANPINLVAASFNERFRTSLVAITSYTTFLRTLLLWIFIFSFIFLIGVIINALKVKFTGVDVFGNQSEALSGWTFLVILISVFFAVTCLNLYIMSIYLSNIYSEIKQRPLYIIESIKRF